jgi:Kef-type K+ transport system membrane component KefB
MINSKKRQILMTSFLATGLLFATQVVFASGEPGPQGEAAHGLDPKNFQLVLIGLALMLVVAKLGGEVFERFKQPAVLGELVGGILIGNLALFGFTFVGLLKSNEIINAVAEIGVIILLFEVGLESNLTEMMEVGWSSLLVAVAGVIAPFFLGWGVAAYFLPEEATLGHIFIGATLCATSVGITARVLKDMGKLQTREARIVLGAAVIDDVLGLLILAVVAGSIKASAGGGTLAMTDVAIIAGKSIIFLVGAIAIGHYLMPTLFRSAGRLESRGVLLALAIAFCFFFAWVAGLVGLAPIVGAFAAGLVLDESHFETFSQRGESDITDLITPLSTVLVPIFFVLMGLKVDLRAFARVEVLGFAAALTFVAILGKQVCSLATVEKGINRLAIGLGMIPRGEVGLIFAGIGATLTLPNAQGIAEPVIGPATFAAVVIMVIVTTLVTPPFLKWSMAKQNDDSKIQKADALDKSIEDSIERTKR